LVGYYFVDWWSWFLVVFYSDYNEMIL